MVWVSCEGEEYIHGGSHSYFPFSILKLSEKEIKKEKEREKERKRKREIGGGEGDA